MESKNPAFVPEEAKDQLEVAIPDHDILDGEAKHESEKENGEPSTIISMVAKTPDLLYLETTGDSSVAGEDPGPCGLISPDPPPLNPTSSNSQAEASTSTGEDPGPVYSMVSSLNPKSSESQAMSTDTPPECADTDEGPLYSVVSPTSKTQQLKGKTPGAASTSSGVEEYSTIIVADPKPKGRKKKSKIKTASSPLTPTQFKIASPMAAGVRVEEEGLYSQVSNVPKSVGARNTKKAAEESPHCIL